MLPIIFFMPFVQLILLAYAATFEVKVVNTHVVDFDGTSSSRAYIRKFSSTNYFKIVNASYSYDAALEDMKRNKISLIIIIPVNFEKEIAKQGKPRVQFVLNAIDGFSAGVIQTYLAGITFDYTKDIITDMKYFRMAKPVQTINVVSSYWYNQELDYKEYMVPGILVILVTIIGMFLSSMNVVKEKELGTIEQLNVTPIKKYQFITGKLLPFWIIAMFDLAFGLTLGKYLFHTPILGNIFLIFGLASLYLLVILAYGLFISTITETQQQAMFMAWFFALVFIMMSGLFTPIDSMPHWAQIITLFNPIAQFVEIMRRVLLKGSGLLEVQKQVSILSAYAVVMIVLAVWRYRKVSG